MFPVSLMIFAGSCIAAVSCQFQITSVNGRPASSGSFSSGSANDGGSQFSISSVNGRPVSTSGSLGSTLLDTNLMRIEVELVRFENPQSLMFDGRFCDTASKCDPKFSADLDTVTPQASWPGSKPMSTWQPVFETTNQDVFNINRQVVRDVCAGVSLANLRVQVNDIDDVTQPDLIDEFECVFDIGRVAPDAFSAMWSTVTECRSRYHSRPPVVRLFYRHREYALPRSQFVNC